MMQSKNLRVYSISFPFSGGVSELLLLADFSTIGLDWPMVVIDSKSLRLFKYQYNEVMDSRTAAHAGGFAKYLEISPDEIPEGVTPVEVK